MTLAESSNTVSTYQSSSSAGRSERYEKRALDAMLCLTLKACVCGIILCSVAKYINDQEQVGMPIMITGIAMFFSASICGFLYLRMLCAQQCQNTEVQPTPVTSTLYTPTITVVVDKPQDEDPVECRPTYTDRV